ncbi:hypothetical protein PLICRDRAFT_103138 [Plicaturopsis crispa FD-325 SS-3]|nr:hypothetical protein PLICRDRAFT_103138 [Plicaturopsis crispa FD-325 SS-3]
MKRDDDLAAVHEKILRSRLVSAAAFERRHAHIVHDYDFQPGALVLVLNKRLAPPGSNTKCRPRYFGPMVVVRRSRNGSYRLAEVDGAVSKLKYAAFRLIPYFPRSSHTLDITEFIGDDTLTPDDDEV